MQGKCAVCDKEGEVFVASSACGAMSLAYCAECLASGAEPWSDLVFYVSLAGHYPDQINEMYREIVRDTCKRLHRTEEEFAAAVETEINKIDEICDKISQIGCTSFPISDMQTNHDCPF